MFSDATANHGDATVALTQGAEGEKETGRIEAFSDGVFAIATTLLVLEVKVPVEHITSGADLWNALLAQWPHYLAYVTGFISIVIMWINHHMLFRYIRRSSHGLLIANSLLLMAISFMPFPTALVAEYISPLDSGMARVAMIVYSSVSIVIAILYNVLWREISHNNRLINKNADPAEVRAVTQSYMLGPLFYLVGLLLAFVSAPASLLTSLGLLLFFLLPGRVQGSLAGTIVRTKNNSG